MTLIVTQAERERIFALAEDLTGMWQYGSYKREILVTNVMRRAESTGKPSVTEYLNYALHSEVERPYLVSALTIHTTDWFRELPHFERLYSLLLAKIPYRQSFFLRMLSAACSTGEEVYSFGLVLEFMRKTLPHFDYYIEGFDIDPLCIEAAKKAEYALQSMQKIPIKYHSFLKQGTKTFTVHQNILKRVSFYSDNLLHMENVKNFYDIIVCRNVLIYFDMPKVNFVIDNLLKQLNAGGFIILGHMESIHGQHFGLKNIGNSIYCREQSFGESIGGEYESGLNKII